MLKKAILSLAISWTFLILVLCLVNFNDLPTVKVSGVDKCVHFTFHLIFTLLWGYYSWLKFHQIIVRKLFSIILASLFFGIVIEFLQEAFTTTRHADVFDVLANFSGALFGLLIFTLIKKAKKA